MRGRFLHGRWEFRSGWGSCWSRQSCSSRRRRVLMKPKASSSEGRFAYEGLDRGIHERARLSILTSLITNPKALTFGDLKQLCSLTDGNLSRHLSVLEEAKMVQILKGHDRNRPQTVCRITPSGRKRYLEYLSTLEQVVKDAAKGTKEEATSNSIRGLTPREA